MPAKDIALAVLVQLIWGVGSYVAFQPYAQLGRAKVGNLSFANYDLMLIGIAALLAFLS